MDKIEPSYIVINNQADLPPLYKILSKEDSLGIDLESDSMFHYREKVCLLQISTRNNNFLIDTISIKNLTPLLPIFSNPSIRKIFHGADYDIRSLYRDFQIGITSLFDTQIAVKFLGITQTGLSYTLENRFGISIDKKYQRSDWSRRPLSKAMIKYAVQDTCHLLPLADILEKELHEKGRFSWFLEECDLLTRVRPAVYKDEPLFLKFKGASKLDPRSIAILEGILRLREELAIKRDIPPFKILENSQILKMVKERPLSIDDLDALSPKQKMNIGKSILKSIQSGMEISENNLPVFPKSQRRHLGAVVTKNIDILKRWRERIGEKLGLDPSVICPNSLIEAIALMNHCSSEGFLELAELKKWQRDLYGREICDLLNRKGLEEKTLHRSKTT
jgi:ribonuclease D